RRHHAARAALAALAGRGHVVRIAAHAEAGELRVDARTACLRPLVLLKHQDARAIAHHETVAARVPWTRSALGIVVARGPRLHRAEPAQRRWRGGELRAAGDHRVGIAVLDHARRQADVVRGRGAGRDRGDVGAARTGHDRYLPGHHVDDGAGHVERRDLSRPALVVLDGGLFDALEATDAGTDRHADAVGVGIADLEPGIGDRHQRRRHAVVDEGVHLLDVLRRDPLRRVEALDRAGNARGECGRVEMGDRADPGAAVDDAVPARGQVIAERRQDADSGDGDAALGHGQLSLFDAFVGSARFRRRDAKRTRPQCGPGFVTDRPEGSTVSPGATTPGRQARRARPASRLDVGLDVVDRLLHRGDLLGFLVGDLALELVFERHYQFDGVERIRAEVVDEGRACADLLVLDAQLFDHDLLDAFFDAAHWL